MRMRPSLEWLVLAGPVAALLHWHGGLESWVFITACLGIIPASRWMGMATEHIAERTTAGVGGLLNATCGNAAELVIAIVALHAGLPGLVKATLTGSIIGNLLLVLGGSCLWGGLKHHRLHFNVAGISAYSSMLFLAAVALLLPAAISAAVPEGPLIQRHLSLELSVVLILVYGCSLLFSLRTHPRLFSDRSRDPAADSSAPAPDAQVLWSVPRSLATMLGATLVLAVLADWMVGSVHEAALHLGMSKLFVGVIIVSMVGNAAEHASALRFARQDRMDLVMAISIGSSIQIALLVAPLLVFISYAVGPQPLDLAFTGPEVLAIILAVLVTEQVVRDGETHWLEGVQLLSVYVVLALLFHALPDDDTLAAPGSGQHAPAIPAGAPASSVLPASP